MKQTLIVFCVCFVSLFTGLYEYISPILCMVLSLICTGLFSLSVHLHKQKKLLNKMANEKNDIWVIGCHPETGKAPDIERLKDEHEIIISIVPNDDVFKVADEYKNLLIRSGNPFFMHTGMIEYLTANNLPILSPDKAIEIHILKYRYGIDRMETWGEYEIRSEARIKGHVEMKHGNLSEENKKFYDVNYHGGSFSLS